VRAVVCGGRAYRDRAAVYRALDRLLEDADGDLMIACGGALGADALARGWALSRGVPCAVFDAPWKALGTAAGPTRNQWLLDYVAPDVVLAFPGGRGTQDMVRRAESAGVPVGHRP
jgi:hypothetical protein